MSSAPLSEISGITLVFPPNHPSEEVARCKELHVRLLDILAKFNATKGEAELFYLGLPASTVTQIRILTKAHSCFSSLYTINCRDAITPLNNYLGIIENLNKSINKMEAVRYQNEIVSKKDKPAQNDPEEEEEEETDKEAEAAKPLYELERSLFSQWNKQQSQRCKGTVALITQTALAIFTRSLKAATALDYLHRLSTGQAIKQYGFWVNPEKVTKRIALEKNEQGSLAYSFNSEGLSQAVPLDEQVEGMKDYYQCKEKFRGLIGHYNRIKGEAESAALAFGSSEVIDAEELDKHLEEVWINYSQQYDKSCEKPEVLVEDFFKMVKFLEAEITKADSVTTKLALTVELTLFKEMANMLTVRSHRALFIINGLAYGRNNKAGLVRFALQPEGMLQKTFYLLHYWHQREAAKFGEFSAQIKNNQKAISTE